MYSYLMIQWTIPLVDIPLQLPYVQCTIPLVNIPLQLPYDTMYNPSSKYPFTVTL